MRRARDDEFADKELAKLVHTSSGGTDLAKKTTDCNDAPAVAGVAADPGVARGDATRYTVDMSEGPPRRRPQVAVIGHGDATGVLVRDAERVGELLVDAGCRVVCGGLGGVMAAVARGAHASLSAGGSDVIGLLPSLDPATASPWVDVVIPTGLHQGRNLLVVASADVVVALGGASGTLSELALAWQLGKPIVALTTHPGWAAELAGRPIDDRRADVVHAAASPEDVVARVLALLSATGCGRPG